MSWNIAKPGDQINGPVAVTGNLNVDSNTLFVDSANNRVGVLTASPTVPLDVVGDAKVSGNLTVDTNTLVVDAANNRLGIGTATPVTKLNINGEVALPLDNLIYWNAYYGTGSFKSIAAGKSGYIATLADGSLQFSNTTASAASADQSISFTERLRIASDGVCTWSNVGGVAGTAMTLNGSGLGIGATPATGNSAGLTVGAIGASKNITLSMYQANARIREWDATNTVALVTNINVDNVIDNNTLSSWKVQLGSGLECFRVARAAAGSTTFAEFFRVDSTGNVGIGTATPSGKLHVEGANIVLKNGTGVPFFQIAGRNTDGKAEFNFLNNGLSVNNAKLVGYTNTLAFEVAGSERLRIKSTGQARFVPLASAPASPESGDVYYDSSTNKLRCYNGTTWNDLF